jgi:serine/threonine protein phosphatase 1
MTTDKNTNHQKEKGQKGKIFAIGDIHGCNNELKRLLSLIDSDPLTDKIVFLGDYIDRGPDSRAVIDTVLDFKKTFPDAICLRGNHEELFLDSYLNEKNVELYLFNRGASTLHSYGVSIADFPAVKFLPEEHLQFFTNLPLYYETDDYIFVHAGLRPKISLEEQSPEDILWIRSEFINSRWDFGKTVIFGHTPLSEPLIEKNKIGIDTGAVYGGHLTCLELPSLKIIQV